mmetsp:Transcript_10618/g.44028  ORF Transcript_10618/g.44028 Transcript_10618/m.44028 type:complete len:225 (+) Transcript_10618:1980-2654(+)
MGGGMGVRARGVTSARQPSTTTAVAAAETQTSHPNACSSTVPSAVNTRRTSASSSSHLTSGARSNPPDDARGYRISRLRYHRMFPRVHTWTPCAESPVVVTQSAELSGDHAKARTRSPAPPRGRSKPPLRSPLRSKNTTLPLADAAATSAPRGCHASGGAEDSTAEIDGDSTPPPDVSAPEDHTPDSRGDAGLTSPSECGSRSSLLHTRSRGSASPTSSVNDAA